ncbi:MAG: FAD-binding oxidoreductase [Anaerolineaceae bacterium]|nr:FAD-binding oxidoreductase [Anaerolineaceae bacterium]
MPFDKISRFQEKIKQVLDPLNILNPGKVIPD